MLKPHWNIISKYYTHFVISLFAIFIFTNKAATANTSPERVYNIPIPLEYLMENYHEVFNLNSVENPLVGPTTWQEDQEANNKNYPDILLSMTLGQSFFKKVLIFKQETTFESSSQVLSIQMTLDEKVEGIPLTPFRGIEKGSISYRYDIRPDGDGIIAELFYTYTKGLFEKKLIEISVNAFEERWRQILASFRRGQ